MAPSDVPFHEIARPVRPDRGDRTVNPLFGTPSIYIPTEEERRLENAYQLQVKKYEEIVAACARTFDAPYGLAWPRTEVQYGEMANLSPLQILNDEEDKLFQRFGEAAKARGYPDVSDFRSLSIYEFDTAGRTRRVCLVFGENGLSHVFLLTHDFQNVLDEIYSALSRHLQMKQDQFYSYDVFVERRYWLDKDRRILVTGKDHVVGDGILARLQALVIMQDFFDEGLPEFLAYTDLARRAQVFEEYKRRALPALRAALSDAANAAEAVQERKAAIERAKEERLRSETRQLLDSFR